MVEPRGGCGNATLPPAQEDLRPTSHVTSLIIGHRPDIGMTDQRYSASISGQCPAGEPGRLASVSSLVSLNWHKPSLAGHTLTCLIAFDRL